MKKLHWIISAVWASTATLFALAPSTFAATYELDPLVVTDLGTASTDYSNSIVWIIGDLLPVFIPVIVVGFAVGFIRWMVWKRG